MCLGRSIRYTCKSETERFFFNCTENGTYWRYRPEWDIHFQQHATMDKPSDDSLDLSTINFINDLWIIAPLSQIIIKTSAFLPVTLWGVFGNVMLLYIIIQNKHLHSPTNLLIANMALADLLILLVHPWVFLINDFFQNYQLGYFGCKAEGGMECAVLLTSVINLLAISYDRLNAIVITPERRLTKSGAKFVMVSAWFIGCALATPLFVYRTYKERQWLDFLEKFCTENAVITNIYWHVIITMMVWLPLGIMLVCYVALFIKLKRYEQVVLRRVKSTNVNYKKKVAKMMFIVITAFMICRLPFTALIFYRNELLKQNNLMQTQHVMNQANGTYHALWFSSRYLIFVNAAVNPVIYGLTSEKFLRAFKETTASKWIFSFPMSQNKSKVKVKNEQKQNNTATTTNKIKIFFIFRTKVQRSKNVRTTDTAVVSQQSGSNVPVLK